ncbi:MAG TPA: hypothetical protein VEC16_06485 [Alphaproteobacteria bacterium]|nr:hypothetical protein [Alphaproteobacteria bacterium]
MSINLFHFSEDGKFFRQLDGIKKLSGSPFRVTLYMYDKRCDIINIFSQFRSDISVVSNFIKISEDSSKIAYECKVEIDSIRESEKDKVKSYLIISKVKQIAILVSNHRRDEYIKIVSFFNRFYPFINRVFMRSFQILEILNQLDKTNRLKIIAKSYVARRYFGKPKSEICYETNDYKTVFKNVSEDKLWVDSILLSVIREKDTFMIRLNRKGIFSYSGITFSEIYYLVLEKMIDYFVDYLNFIENKGRSISKLDPSPIRISLTDDVFVDSQSFEKMLARIRTNLTDWGFSVLSSDSIFGHIMLHDYASGSCFDLYIGSSKQIDIIPQTQVTDISFNRLLSFVLDNYEGALENA